MNAREERFEGHRLGKELGDETLPECICDEKTGLKYKLVDETYYFLDGDDPEDKLARLGVWADEGCTFLSLVVAWCFTNCK